MWSLFMADALAQAVCVEGSCPSQLSLQIQAVTPAGGYALVQGSGLGSGRLASGPCRGSTGLSGPTLLERGRADYNGRAVSFAEPTAACGTGYLSVLDMTTCTFSTPVALVGSSSCGGATWGVRPGDFYDFDVADSGATVEIFGDGAAMRATCTGADGVEVASGVWLGQDGVETFAAVSVSDVSERAIVVWRSLWHGSAERLRYAYLDETCTPIVTDALIDENAYFEFFDVALDDAGSGVLALNEGETKLYWISADGALTGPQSAFDLGDEYGVHVALDRDGTGGIVAAQEHSGDGIWYRRFSGRGRFIEPGPVWVEDVSYHYWYDGFTVGMNDDGAFLVTWRSSDRAIEALTFAPDGSDAGYFLAITPDFSGALSDFPYDSFRRRHQEVAIRGSNFIIGEAYDLVAGSGRKIRYYELAPDASVVSQSATTQSVPEGLTLRVDGMGNAYVRGPGGLYDLGQFP